MKQPLNYRFVYCRKLGMPQKAENFLLDVMTSYHQEGWKKLRDVTRLELAQCQYQVADHQKYPLLQITGVR